MQSPSGHGGAGTRASSIASPPIAAAPCRFSRPVLLVLFLFSILNDAAAFLAASNSQSTTHTRPCSSSSSLPPDSKGAKESSKTKFAGTPVPPPACLEVKGNPIEVQEFLQALIRDQKWRIGQEQTSANSWSFVRNLEPEELVRFAHTEILGGSIVWTEGKAAVQVATAGATDGFTRVQIAAKVLGKGNTKERFARPTDFWPLVSKGTLESGMIAALEDHFKAQSR
jgi:hypothetical protein